MIRLRRYLVGLSLALSVAAAMAGLNPSMSAQPATPAAPCGIPSAATPMASPVGGGASIGEPELLAGPPEHLVWVGGPHAVVLLHQSNLNMRSWARQAEAIATAGYTVVAIQNTGPNGLRIAIDDLRTGCGITTVTVVGASVGGMVAQEALRTDPAAFDSVVVLSSPVDVALLGAIPKLFVGTEGEITSFDPVSQAETSAGEDNTAVLYPGDAHGQEIFDTEYGPDLLSTLIDWLAAHP